MTTQSSTKSLATPKADISFIVMDLKSLVNRSVITKRYLCSPAVLINFPRMSMVTDWGNELARKSFIAPNMRRSLMRVFAHCAQFRMVS